MKVIDLLNKIANGEEVPEKIKYNDEVYKYNYEIKDYEYEDECGWLMDISRNNGNEFLNDEVEIIEEKPKHIEEIMKIDTRETRECIIKFQVKANEMIKALNYLLDKEKE